MTETNVFWFESRSSLRGFAFIQANMQSLYTPHESRFSANTVCPLACCVLEMITTKWAWEQKTNVSAATMKFSVLSVKKKIHQRVFFMKVTEGTALKEYKGKSFYLIIHIERWSKRLLSLMFEAACPKVKYPSDLFYNLEFPPNENWTALKSVILRKGQWHIYERNSVYVPQRLLYLSEGE